MRKLLVITLLIVSLGYSQNLVVNPSFEDPFGPITDIYGLNFIDGWRAQNSNSNLSPELSPLFNVGAANPDLGVPGNAFGNAKPHESDSGENGYSFLTTFSTFDVNGRTYLGGTFSRDLTTGSKYYWSYWVQMCDVSGYATDGFGIKLLRDAAANGFPDGLPTSFDTSYVADSLEWVKVSGSFIADSTYQFFALGNFFYDGTTTFLQVTFRSQSAFYYVDNVCVSTNSTECGISPNARITQRTPLKMAPTYGTYTDIDNPGNEVAIVTDIHGVEVIRTRDKRIDFGNLPKGLYFVRIARSVGTFLNY